MTITVVVELPTKTESIAELVGKLKAALPDTRGYDGCSGAELVQDQDAATLLIIERWASRPHYDKYLGWRMETGFMDAVGPNLTGDPVIRYFDTKDA